LANDDWAIKIKTKIVLIDNFIIFILFYYRHSDLRENT